MPKGWSDRDERKYDHIREGNLERGMSESKAEEIAARTVNKGRREEGRTENTRTQGSGNPNRSYEGRTRDELYNVAKERNIEGRSRMSKDELIRALRK
jgi:plasmid stabilization system protein ParE